MNRILTVRVLATLAHDGISIYASCVEPSPMELNSNKVLRCFMER